VNVAIGLGVAYLSGSIPAAYLVGRAHGVDLADVGSGNYGATNVFRILGPWPASAALVVDVAKGLLPVLLIPRWFAPPGLAPSTWGVLIAVAAVLGHVFPLWLRFRGGKGVGTAFGAFLALAPGPILVAAFVWVAALLWRRIVSLASLSAAAALLAGVLATRFGTLAREWPVVVVTAALVAFVFWTHRENIDRLSRGEERPVRARSGKR